MATQPFCAGGTGFPFQNAFAVAIAASRIYRKSPRCGHVINALRISRRLCGDNAVLKTDITRENSLMTRFQEQDRRKTRGNGSAKLTEEHFAKIARNIARMQPDDHWSLATLLGASVWNNLSGSWKIQNQIRRDLGRDFCIAVATGRVPQLARVHGTRAPVLWQRIK